MKAAFRILAVVSALLVGGCTVAELQRQEREDAARVRQKEAVLQAEQERETTLSRQKDQLAQDLSERQVSLVELNQRIEQLRSANNRASAESDQVRQERQHLVIRLQDYSAQLAEAKRAKQDADPYKQERIEYLKHQIQNQLDLLLH